MVYSSVLSFAIFKFPELRLALFWQKTENCLTNERMLKPLLSRYNKSNFNIFLLTSLAVLNLRKGK